jgi:hypothetical protein
MEQTIYEVISDKRSVPFNSEGTGTISTFGVAVVGTGTLFTTEMPVGSYLVDLDSDEVRKVVRVDSNTKAFLEKPFSADITSDAPEIVAAWQCKAKEISLETEDECEINGATFTGIVTIAKPDIGSQRPNIVAPIIVDATGGHMNVLIVNY